MSVPKTAAEKIRKAREFRLPLDGGPTLIVRRPSDLQLLKYRNGYIPPEDLHKFVVGWEGMKDCDLFPGGGGEPAVFDQEACAEWLQDHVDHIVALAAAIQENVNARVTQLEAAEKNSPSGSTPAPSQASHLPHQEASSTSSAAGT